MKAKLFLTLLLAAAFGAVLTGCHAEGGFDVQSNVPSIGQ